VELSFKQTLDKLVFLREILPNELKILSFSSNESVIAVKTRVRMSELVINGYWYIMKQ
jgi:hypothetical protein